MDLEKGGIKTSKAAIFLTSENLIASRWWGRVVVIPTWVSVKKYETENGLFVEYSLANDTIFYLCLEADSHVG